MKRVIESLKPRALGVFPEKESRASKDHDDREGKKEEQEILHLRRP
ncbi:hypothetical protein OAF55_03850 [Akkermansiaceae bacterium]|nr:hypothetical protein [Akkermansiaceae bacterium]